MTLGRGGYARGRWSLGVGRGLTLLLSPLHHHRRDLDNITGIELKTRNPDTFAIDPHVAPVNHRLRRATRKIKLERQEILQELGIGLVDGEGRNPRGMLGSASHRIRPS